MDGAPKTPDRSTGRDLRGPGSAESHGSHEASSALRRAAGAAYDSPDGSPDRPAGGAGVGSLDDRFEGAHDGSLLTRLEEVASPSLGEIERDTISRLVPAHLEAELKTYAPEIKDQLDRAEALFGKRLTPQELMILWTPDADHGDKDHWKAMSIDNLLPAAKEEIVQMLRALRSGDIEGLALRPHTAKEGDFHIYNFQPDTNKLAVALIDLKTIADQRNEVRTEDKWSAPEQAKTVKADAIKKNTVGNQVELDPLDCLNKYQRDLDVLKLATHAEHPPTAPRNFKDMIIEADRNKKTFILHVVAVADSPLSESDVDSFVDYDSSDGGQFFLVDKNDVCHPPREFSESKKIAEPAPTGAGDMFGDDDEW